MAHEPVRNRGVNSVNLTGRFGEAIRQPFSAGGRGGKREISKRREGAPDAAGKVGSKSEGGAHIIKNFTSRATDGESRDRGEEQATPRNSPEKSSPNSTHRIGMPKRWKRHPRHSGAGNSKT